MRKLRIVVIVIVILVVIGGLLSVAAKKRATAAQKPTIVRVEAATLGALTEIVSAPGEIEPKVNVEISAKTSGRVVALPYREGETVTKGDPNASPPVPASVLVRLDSKDLESRLLSAQADRAARAAQIEVEKARISAQESDLIGLAASREQAERDFQRQAELLKSRDISEVAHDEAKVRVDELRSQYASSQHSLEAARLNLKVLEHNLESADAVIAQARESLSYTTIVSPIDGMITRINAEVGEMVMTGTMNNAGTIIMQVGDLSEMLVVAEVDESDVGKLEVGQGAQVHIQAWPEKVFRGQVRAIALSHDLGNQGSKYYETEILLIDPNERIFTGMTADVDVEVAYHNDVLVLPSQAVLGRPVDELPVDIRDTLTEEEKSKTYATVVFRYVDGKALITPVQIGAGNATHTIVTGGIEPGDKIVTGPYKELEALQHEKSIKDEREAKAEEEAKKKGETAGTPDANDSSDVDS